MNIMPQAIGWQSLDGCGRWGRDGVWTRPAPLTPADAAAVADFFGRPVRYFARLTEEARSALVACHLALLAAGQETAPAEFALLGAGYDGCLAADRNYFGDYVRHGRTLGRGGLFVYTLPSSTLGEISLALGVGGPNCHVHDGQSPAGGLLDEAALLLERGEARGVLAVYSGLTAAICALCLAAGEPWPPPPGIELFPEGDPAATCRRLMSAAGHAAGGVR